MLKTHIMYKIMVDMDGVTDVCTCIWKSFSVVFKTETKYYWRLAPVRFETIQVPDDQISMYLSGLLIIYQRKGDEINEYLRLQ